MQKNTSTINLDTEIVEHAPLQRPNIGFLYVPDDKPVFGNSQQLAAWMSAFSELHMICDAESLFIAASHRDTPVAVLDRICETLEKRYDDFDGFVVLLPRQDILFQASNLSLRIAQTGKPIVCTSDFATGLQTRFRDYYSAAFKSEMMSASHIAYENISGVVAMAGIDVVAPAHARIEYTEQRPYITSTVAGTLGFIDFGLHLGRKAVRRANTKPLKLARWKHVDVRRIVLDEKQALNVPRQLLRTERKTRGLIAQVSGVAPLSLLSAIPQTLPVCIVSASGAQISWNGEHRTVSSRHASAVAAQFTAVLSTLTQKQLKNPLAIERAMQKIVFPFVKSAV